MDAIVQEVKESLEISSSDKDGLIKSIVKRCMQPILNYIKESTVPSELEYIVVEMALARYNKLGSEGITNESIDGVSYSYSNDILDGYRDDLDIWINNNSASKNKVKVRLI